MQISIDTEPCHHHISYAVFYKLTIHNINGILSQAFEKAVVNRSNQIADIIRRIILDGVIRRADYRLFNIILVVQIAKGVFKRINDLALVFGAHIPYWDRS